MNSTQKYLISLLEDHNLPLEIFEVIQKSEDDPKGALELLQAEIARALRIIESDIVTYPQR